LHDCIHVKHANIVKLFGSLELLDNLEQHILSRLCWIFPSFKNIILFYIILFLQEISAVTLRLVSIEETSSTFRCKRRRFGGTRSTFCKPVSTKPLFTSRLASKTLSSREAKVIFLNIVKVTSPGRKFLVLDRLLKLKKLMYCHKSLRFKKNIGVDKIMRLVLKINLSKFIYLI